MEQSGMIQTYFDKNARQFDRLYQQEAPLLRLFNYWMRRPFYRRFELTMQACGDVRGKRILDVGCGSGRYAVALAEQGAEVLGIDFASNMLDLACALAEKRKVVERCRFVNADFLRYDLEGTFNISLAIGVFDYVRNPLTILERLCALTEEQVIVTFPTPGGWRAHERKVRYWIKGCPIFFHSRESMTGYFASAGYKSWRFVGSWAVTFPRGSQDLVIDRQGETQWIKH
jgi:2-polyprenyl-3-methyl-5-hydroxy-6-metoxy-1,4-benzoquinol methylase